MCVMTVLHHCYIIELKYSNPVFITLLNCMKVKVVARGQSLMSFLTVMTLFFIIFLGIYYWATGEVVYISY